MIPRVTLKKITKHSALLLGETDAAILVSGQLHLISHEEEVASPSVVAVYNPGDVVGIDIDNGWYRQKHSWLCAWEEVYVLLVSGTYARFLWDKQRQFSANLIADMIDQAPFLSQMSE